MIFLKPAFLASMLILIGYSTYAAESVEVARYRPVEGKGYTACEAFLKNLNAFPPEEPPMVCEQKVHPTHPEFRRPAWEEMDVWSNLNLIYEAERLLWRFTPIGTEPKPFEEWKRRYQQRVESGKSKPRLRKATLPLIGNNPETLIWYEPMAGECSAELESTGVSGDPGGYIFVLRTNTSQLQAFGGLLGTQSRTDVLLYHSKPYFTTVSPDFELIGKGRRPVWVIGFHPIASRRTHNDQYLIRHRCEYRADRSEAP